MMLLVIPVKPLHQPGQTLTHACGGIGKKEWKNKYRCLDMKTNAFLQLVNGMKIHGKLKNMLTTKHSMTVI